MTRAALRVPLVDLRAGYRRFREEILRGFDATLERMQLMLGPELLAFEGEFASFCGAPHGLAVSNGTDALYAALAALELPDDAEVILPSLGFFATAESVIRAGATPVFVDVEPDTLTIDPARVEEALTPKTAAIVPVHLYGQPADMDPLLALAAERGLRVVEDAAQAHGARYRGRRCGSLGDAGCFSFYFTKNLGAYGEGGFVTCRDAEVAERIRLLRHHGHLSKFEHGIVAGNLRADELQAVVLRIRLRHLEEDNECRRALAGRYRDHLAGSPLRLLEPRPDSSPVHHLFVVRTPARDALRDHLLARGVETGIHYPVPTHRQPALRGHRHRVGPMKETEEACGELLSLPLYPELSEEDLDFVAGHVLAFLRDRGDAA